MGRLCLDIIRHQLVRVSIEHPKGCNEVFTNAMTLGAPLI